jgi:ribonuclease E
MTDPGPADPVQTGPEAMTSTSTTAETAAPAAAPRRRRAASRQAGAPGAAAEPASPDAAAPEEAAAEERAPKRARATRKTASKKTAAVAQSAAADTEAPGADSDADAAAHEQVAPEQAPTKRAARKSTARRRTRASEETAADAAASESAQEAHPEAETPPSAAPPLAEEQRPAAKTRRTRKRATAPAQPVADGSQAVPDSDSPLTAEPPSARDEAAAEPLELQTATDEEALGAVAAEEAAQVESHAAAPTRPGVLIFQAPIVAEPVRRAKSAATRPQKQAAPEADAEQQAPPAEDEEQDGTERDSRRRRRRGHSGQGTEAPAAVAAKAEATPADEPGEGGEGGLGDDAEAANAGESDGSSRRRRRRRRRQTAEDLAAGVESDDPPNTVLKIREPRERRAGRVAEPDSVRTGDDVLGVRGSVRLAAKQQRRRDGRSTRSRRAPIVSEAEFLARRESVDRVMVVRQSANRTQIAVLEDGVLVEHYVNRESSVSYVGNVYLGKVQNVLPSMEAAFVDINKGRNAVLYAGEVNFSAAGLEGQPKRIESALRSGQPVLVQVTKDPIGHKGARLTSQISLPGRFLVYIPGGSMMGISRKLPDNERTRLKQILKKVVPEDGGVIVRTAAEGASEEELARDVERLVAQWEEIERRARTANAPALLYGEPDLTVRVIRDIFNEDFAKLVVSGDEAYKTIHEYLSGVAPELAERLGPWTGDIDVFTVHRVDEQLAKALDRKVWLPSGGSLVIDRTEAMVVIDVNTGKFTGQGSTSLEETVTRNNLEAAEEIVRQLRLRDLGGIIVIDFIDMVLESNRELVLRRLLECLGRDRTKHQVAEVTSLGLVQMTRKRVGQGLLEAFSETCDHCNGRGIVVHMDPVEPLGRRSDRQADRGSAAAARSGAPAEDGEIVVVDDDEAGLPPASSAETRASRRRRRKGKHHEGEDAAGAPAESESDWAADAVGTPAPESAAPPAPRTEIAQISLKAHADDPDSVSAEDGPAPAPADNGRPRKRRRAASRPAGSPRTSAEAS